MTAPEPCLFPGGRPGAEANGRKYEDQPCGAAALYERHGCRGPQCRKEHAEKIALYRKGREERDNRRVPPSKETT